MVECLWDENGFKYRADCLEKRKHLVMQKRTTDPKEAGNISEGRELLGQVACEEQDMSI